VTKPQSGLRLDQPAVYQIQVQGRLKDSWSPWFDGMEVETVTDAAGLTVTRLSGEVSDQPALHGVLNRIRDLGIPLISVQLVGLPPEKE